MSETGNIALWAARTTTSEPRRSEPRRSSRARLARGRAGRTSASTRARADVGRSWDRAQGRGRDRRARPVAEPRIRRARARGGRRGEVRPRAGGEVRTGDLGLLRGGDDARSAPTTCGSGGGSGRSWGAGRTGCRTRPRPLSARARACATPRCAIWAAGASGDGRGAGRRNRRADDGPRRPTLRRWPAGADASRRFRRSPSAEVAVVQTRPPGKILLSKVWKRCGRMIFLVRFSGFFSFFSVTHFKWDNVIFQLQSISGFF